MKICFVSLFSYPLFSKKENISFGGSEIQLYNIGNKIAENKENDVSFIVGNFGQEKIEFYRKIKLIRSIKIKERVRMISKFFSVIMQFYYLFLANADVYVKRAAGPEVGIISLFCKIFNKKFVYMTAHETDCNGEYVRNNFLQGNIFLYGIKNADLVITQSSDYQLMLKENFKVNSKIIYSGYKIPETFIPVDEREYILWVARLEKWKQPEIFIEIARKFPKEKFVMIAPGANNKLYGEMIGNVAKKTKNINFIPGVSFRGIDKYFKKAKIFINTSRNEGFPNTFIQSAMWGVPVISYKVNPDSLIEKYNFGFCSYGEKDELNKLVKKIITDIDLRKKISNNAYLYAKNNHNIESIVERFISYIR